MKRKLHTTLNKPWQHVVASAVAFALAYAAASWAIDSGRLWAYFIALVLTIIGIKQFIQASRKANAK